MIDTVWLKTSNFLSEIETCVKEDLTHTPANTLTITGVYILNALYDTDGQRASDLARAIGVAATSFTPMLDKLQKAGFVKRSNSKSDRRSVVIHLTKAGRDLQDAIEMAVGNVEVRYGGK